MRTVSEYNNELKSKGFNAFQSEGDTKKSTRVYSRKDFYKICITTGHFNIHYADKTYEVDGTVLFFGNPHIPYSWEHLSVTQSGYVCLFSEEFFKSSDRSESLQQSPLFKIGGTPIIPINEQQEQFLNGIFQRMIDEQQTDYVYKGELIRNYINLIIHEALKLQPSENFDQHKNAASRVTSVFLELLERQFPIESANHPLQLTTANDFATSLNIHVNYLNRAVNETTGRSTTSQISDRILNEAKALLQHTDWNISEIAYALGFEYPSHFNSFFKKLTGANPGSFRTRQV
jgi:AraC-like DNA-binding protein